MRYGNSILRLAAALTAVSVLAACAGGAEKTETPDSAAAAAAAAPPPAESFALASDDGSWSGDISPSGVVFRHKKNDSLIFDYKAPTVTGALSDYDLLMTGKDTVRLTVSLAMTKCTDKAGKEYTHIAQIYLTGDVQMQSRGCATKK